jgi:anaerobic magnesium-protoporphyrin IX monomethyl ester cyclase
MKPKIVLFDSNTVYAGAPLALLQITSLLDLSKFDIHIITKHEFADYLDRILKLCENALCLGITCITGSPILEAIKVSEFVKERYPQLPIIWGGWQPITLPDITLKYPFIDYICTTQGEKVFSEFVAAIKDENYDQIKRIPGISYKANGAIIHNPPRPIEDINHFPDFDPELISWHNHFENSSYGMKTIRINTSIGCPYRCDFCAEHNLCKRYWRGLSAERVISLLKRIYALFPFDSINFTDNNFFVDEKRVRQICLMLIESKINISIGGVSARANELIRYKPETWRLLQEAGFKEVLIGAESANPETLMFIKKDATISQLVETVRLCHTHQIKPVLSFVLGFPLPQYFESSPQTTLNREVDETLSLFKDIYFKITRRFMFFVFFYSPLPSPPMYKLALEMGFEPPKDLVGWARYQLWEINTPWLRRINTNTSRLTMLRHFSQVLGFDFSSYLRGTPAAIRYLGFLIIAIVKFTARIRLQFNFYSLPIDILILRYSERLFRCINRRFSFVRLNE